MQRVTIVQELMGVVGVGGMQLHQVGCVVVIFPLDVGHGLLFDDVLQGHGVHLMGPRGAGHGANGGLWVQAHANGRGQ